VNDVGWIDVLVVGVSVLVVVLFTITYVLVACGFCGIVLDDLLCVDILEDATILHGMTGSRMELTQTLQGLVIVILVVVATSKSLIDLMVAFVGPLSPKVITVVTTITVVDSPIVVMVIVSPRKVVGLLISPHVFSD
jgi:hypothetical protein